MAVAPQYQPLVSVPIEAPSFSVADSRRDRQDAFRLVYQSYLKSGLCQTNRHEMRVTPYHLLDSTTVFISRLRGDVISTMSLVEDGELGLPMESIYGEEVQRRRDSGLKLAEVSCLADRRSDHKRFFEMFVKLARLMAQYARFHRVDQLLIVCHPRHARFYQRYMAFDCIGGLTACPHVQNNPALALCLDFAKVDRERPASWPTFFAEQIPLDDLQRPAIDPHERQHYRRLVRDCFAQVSAPHDEETVATI